MSVDDIRSTNCISLYASSFLGSSPSGCSGEVTGPCAAGVEPLVLVTNEGGAGGAAIDVSVPKLTEPKPEPKAAAKPCDGGDDVAAYELGVVEGIAACENMGEAPAPRISSE